MPPALCPLQKRAVEAARLQRLQQDREAAQAEAQAGLAGMRVSVGCDDCGEVRGAGGGQWPAQAGAWALKH